LSILSNREVVGFAFVFLGGWGGLASALAYLSITDALNRDRPANDQIPQFTVTWSDFKRRLEFLSAHGPFYAFGLVEEFRRKFPHHSAYWWYVGGCIWLVLFGAIGVIAILSAH
jgi:hypothetical protein